MDGRTVIRNGVVPPAGHGATVVVEGNRIAEVAPPGRPVDPRPGDWEIDADGRLVVAGLVNAHTNLSLGGIMRYAGLPGRPPPTVADLRAGFRRRIEGRATAELIEPLARAGALASLKAGVTCAFDLVRGAPGDAAAALEAVARGADATGLRAVVAVGARGPAARAEIAENAAVAAARAADRRVRAWIGLFGLADVPDDALEALAGPARAHGLHACVGEDEGDLAHAFGRFGRRPIELLAASGLLGPRTLVAHAGTSVHGEGVALAGAGASLAVSPRAAMFWGAPLPPLLSFAELGVPVVFGTCGLFADVAAEAFAGALLHRHQERNAGAAGALVSRVAWPAAARLASAAFGAPLGALEAGALADVVVLDWRPAVPVPALPDGDLVFLWAGASAAWVIVDGVVRIREGRLLGGDEGEIAALAREAAERLLAR